MSVPTAAHGERRRRPLSAKAGAPGRGSTATGCRRRWRSSSAACRTSARPRSSTAGLTLLYFSGMDCLPPWMIVFSANGAFIVADVRAAGLCRSGRRSRRRRCGCRRRCSSRSRRRPRIPGVVKLQTSPAIGAGVADLIDLPVVGRAEVQRCRGVSCGRSTVSAGAVPSATAFGSVPKYTLCEVGLAAGPPGRGRCRALTPVAPAAGCGSRACTGT